MLICQLHRRPPRPGPSGSADPLSRPPRRASIVINVIISSWLVCFWLRKSLEMNERQMTRTRRKQGSCWPAFCCQSGPPIATSPSRRLVIQRPSKLWPDVGVVAVAAHDTDDDADADGHDARRARCNWAREIEREDIFAANLFRRWILLNFGSRRA